MRRLILGTAGHIDHGKTALIRALTGTDTDRLPEEKRRGITIDIGFARLAIPGEAEVGIIDVPGHEAFIRNMLAGATGIDLALLVVAADEGVMPQTREHAAILELLGVRALVVALTKIDLVEPDWVGLATDDVRALLRTGPFRHAPIIPVSARTGVGLDSLVGEIGRVARTVEERDDEDLFRLPVDRVFTVHGTGTVVTGTVWSGSISRDHVLRLLPAGRSVRVRGLQTHGVDRDRVRAGERAALALAATGREAMQRGDVLVSGDGWQADTRLLLRLRVLEEAGAGLKHGQRVRFHLATTEAIGRIAAAGAAVIAPGSEEWIQIRLERPVVARAGDPFVIRTYSPLATIGGGRVAEPGGPRRKRPSASEKACLGAVLSGPPEQALAARACLAGWAGESISRMAVTTPFAPDALQRAARDREPAPIDGRFFDAAILDEARSALLAAIDRHHHSEPLSPGVRLEHLRAALPATAATSLVESLLAGLAAAGSITIEANRARRSAFAPRLDPDQQAAARMILEEFDRAGLAAPAPQELPDPLASRTDLADLLHHLVRTSRLVALAPDRFLAPAALEDAIRRASSAFGDRAPLSPADFRDLFGISRKYLIPLLEHFDRTGVTVRQGEGRRWVPNPSSGG
jgi:selenocysteine-specific elongation factor